ncbi:alpha/beta fold hydrolase [Actinomadura fibrosa]|uniref:Alpha/beta fold hydrolase n=1 Tax=Actinomadura fibrosa TaxID=111802 RepID=A0ABW2Y1F2_9ACTN|nr:alpha/beta fold hydrolase [Actinomadura fibrosa]
MSAARGFWITGEVVGGVQRGPMWVEELPPEGAERKAAIVLVHGGGGQGTDWLLTPDGRPGWAPLLAAAGHRVLVVDRPGHGRSPFDPDVLGPPGRTFGEEPLRRLFLGSPDGPPLPPNTRWPGALDGSDEVFAQFAASQGPMTTDPSVTHALERDRLAALLERIGPAVLIAHSAGGPGAWLAADARPDLVLAFVAVETLGPPFVGQPGVPLPWGLAAAPLTYDPPAADAAELRTRLDADGPVPKALQDEPARRLASLARLPIAVVTAQASPFRLFDGHLIEYLQQAGCSPELLRLADAGIDGNGHAMMLERNNAEVLAVITGWLAGRGLDVPDSGTGQHIPS